MKPRTILLVVFYAAILYVAAASITYRFAHPNLTQTELFLDLWKALTFQW